MPFFSLKTQKTHKMHQKNLFLQTLINKNESITLFHPSLCRYYQRFT